MPPKWCWCLRTVVERLQQEAMTLLHGELAQMKKTSRTKHIKRMRQDRSKLLLCRDVSLFSPLD